MVVALVFYCSQIISQIYSQIVSGVVGWCEGAG